MIKPNVSNNAWKHFSDASFTPVGMTIWVRVPGIRRVSDPTDTGTGTIFTRGWHPYLTRTKTGTWRVFFPPTGNLTGTRYFTTVMIIGCEQVKMCSFCDINYDLF
jgi:hypothetical protein